MDGLNSITTADLASGKSFKVTDAKGAVYTLREGKVTVEKGHKRLPEDLVKIVTCQTGHYLNLKVRQNDDGTYWSSMEEVVNIQPAG